MEHGDAYQLQRGEDVLGTLVVQDELCDFPWYGGIFHPAPLYVAVQGLFEEELHLLEGDSMDLWDAAWSRVEEPGLKLIPHGGGAAIEDLIIHIEGSKARWRC